MLAILLHLPNPPSADTLFWLELLGTKSFLQYLFRIWSNCLPVSSPRVLALLLLTAVLNSVSTAPWTKSFSSFREHKETGSWMQVATRAGALGEKMSGTSVLWLGLWSETIPYFWHIPMCGYIHVFTGGDSMQVYGKVSLQCLCS